MDMMSESECNRFFRVFLERFRFYFEALIIKPLEGEELIQSMTEYSRLGLPGCVGSIDCTFVPWDRVSANLKNLYSGDKGVGVLFEVVVTHFKKVVSVGGSVPGTINDKTSVKSSEFIRKLRSREIYNNVSYRIRTGILPNDFINLSSCYVICDGGYLDWEVLITGFQESGNPIKYKFTDWIASVRKDVECFFGILKLRFRFLKNTVTLQKREDIDNAFVVCCMLNNLILSHDGLDTLWEDDVNWKYVNPDFEGEEFDHAPEDEDEVRYTPTLHQPDHFVPVLVGDLLQDHQIRDYGMEKIKFKKLRDLLANHLHLTYVTGELRWPKVRKEIELIHNELPRYQFPNAGDDF